MKEIKTEIIINSSKTEVWKVLTDFEGYPEWNPFIVTISGNPKKGGLLRANLKIDGNKPMTIKPTILASEEDKRFEWLGKAPLGIFNGQHYFLIEEISEKQVKFIQGEYFTGWLVKPILKKIGENTQKGFIKMNRALKKKVESLEK